MRKVGTLCLLGQFLGSHLARRDPGPPESLDEIPAGDVGASSLRDQAAAVNVDRSRKPDLSAEDLRTFVEARQEFVGNLESDVIGLSYASRMCRAGRPSGTCHLVIISAIGVRSCSLARCLTLLPRDADRLTQDIGGGNRTHTGLPPENSKSSWSATYVALATRCRDCI